MTASKSISVMSSDVLLKELEIACKEHGCKMTILQNSHFDAIITGKGTVSNIKIVGTVSIPDIDSAAVFSRVERGEGDPSLFHDPGVAANDAIDTLARNDGVSLYPRTSTGIESFFSKNVGNYIKNIAFIKSSMRE